MLERCPTWGKTIGRLMESDPDEPGVIEILSGEAAGPRIVLSLPALCLLLVLAAAATEATFR